MRCTPPTYATLASTARWLCGASLLALAGCAGLAGTTPSAPPPNKQVWTNSLGMEFVQLPAGSFWMGSEETVEELAAAYPLLDASRFKALADEAPVHQVHISRPFWLGKHEVTLGQFRLFLQASGHVPESVADGTGGYGYNPEYDPATTTRGDAFEGRSPRYRWDNPGFAQADDHPVVNVTWNDAQAMAQWLTQREGVRYRLPTEAEWEYACRAQSRTRYPHGNDPATLTRYANVFDQAAAPYWPRWRQHALPGSDGHAFTAPVGSHEPNAWGLHDMLGNVWEWVADWHDDTYYARSPQTDPQGPETGSVRVRRGGSWHTWAFYARCSYRNWNTPQTRYTLVGFRLLREAPTGQTPAKRP